MLAFDSGLNSLEAERQAQLRPEAAASAAQRGCRESAARRCSSKPLTRQFFYPCDLSR